MKVILFLLGNIGRATPPKRKAVLKITVVVGIITYLLFIIYMLFGLIQTPLRLPS